MPIPSKGEKKDDFISRCIPIVINEGTAKDNSQAYAICNSIWERKKRDNNMNKDRVLLHLSASLGSYKKVGLSSETSSDDEDTYNTIMMVGNGVYNGIYFPTEELEKAFMSFNGVPVNLNHSDDKIEDIVGYVKDAGIDGDKLYASVVLSKDTAKYNAAKGYIKSRKDANSTPNVSIGVYVDRVEEPISKNSDEMRLVARNLDADHLAIVVHGACNPQHGCGIGIDTMSTTGDSFTFSHDSETVWESPSHEEDIEWREMELKIKKEKLKKEILEESLKMG